MEWEEATDDSLVHVNGILPSAYMNEGNTADGLSSPPYPNRQLRLPTSPTKEPVSSPQYIVGAVLYDDDDDDYDYEQLTLDAMIGIIMSVW